MRNSHQDSIASRKKMRMEYEDLRDSIAKLRFSIGKQEETIRKLEAEIDDSNYFIEALQKKLEAVDRSIKTREYFGSLHLDYCPECLSKLSDDVPEGHCHLCKSPIDGSRGRTQAIRIKLELEYQIRESRMLLKKDQDRLRDEKASLRTTKRELDTTQKQYNEAVGNVRSSHDEQIDHLVKTIGYKQGEMVQFKTMLEHAEKYEQLVDERHKLEVHKEELERYIAAAEGRIEQNRRKVERSISENGVYLLKHDEDRQAEFMNATDLKINYKQNIAYISDNRIKLSASSSFYQKLAARFALFLSSLQIDSMLYPRLMFSDNMEDKGMEEDRSRNFQNIIVNRLQELSSSRTPHIPYQLIFATSNIAAELDKEEYTIGEYYTKDNKSLKNVDF